MTNKINNSFFKSISTLAYGSLIAQFITMAASPIMTRFYTSEEIGINTLILTVVSIFGGIICGKYDMSIVTEKEQSKMLSLIKLSLIICISFSLIISLGYGVYYWLTDTENNYIFFMTLSIFALLLTTGIGNILIGYNNRNKEYTLMTSVYVVRTVARTLTMVILGFFKTGVFGLILSQVIGQVFGVKKQSKSVKPYFNKILKSSSEEMSFVAKKHKKQLYFSVPATFANSFSYSSINLFIENLFGLATLGYYSMSFSILGLPLSLISNNVSKVFFEEASREQEEFGLYKKTFAKTSIFLIIIAIPMTLSLIFVAPPLFGWFFGEEWIVSGNYVKLLAPMFGIRFVVTALSPGMILSQKQNFDLLLQLLFILMSVFGFLLAKYFILTIDKYLIFVSLSFSVIYLLYFFILLLYSKKVK